MTTAENIPTEPLRHGSRKLSRKRSPRGGARLLSVAFWALMLSCGGDAGDASKDTGGAGAPGSDVSGSGGGDASGTGGDASGSGGGSNLVGPSSGGDMSVEPDDEVPCVPTGPEECDGIDNDCNGIIDDGLGVQARNAVSGAIVEAAEACDREDDEDECALGKKVCHNGAVVCDESDGRDPTTGLGGPEICDGIDNNCDGQIDEEFGVAVYHSISGDLLVPAEKCDGADADLCADGIWVCNYATGSRTCTDGPESRVELCDGTDRDCDGIVDNVPPGEACSNECGAGTYVCLNAETVCSAATPTTPSCSNPTADVDCNGIPDGQQEQLPGLPVEGSVAWYIDEDRDGYPKKGSEPRYFCPGGENREIAGIRYIRARQDNAVDCCDTDENAKPGQSNYYGSVNACGSWDYNCNDGVEKRPEPSGPNQCFRSCLDVANGQTGWDQIFCGSCNPPCGAKCPYVSMTQCIFPPTEDRTMQCR